MTTITSEEARRQFSNIINRVAYAKEHVILMRRGKRIAALVPVEGLDLLEALTEKMGEHRGIDAVLKAFEEIKGPER